VLYRTPFLERTLTLFENSRNAGRSTVCFNQQQQALDDSHQFGFNMTQHKQPARLQRENKTVQTMIRMYCHAHHNAEGDLCDDCLAVAHYAEARVASCPYGYDKPTCANCTTHCYKHDMRERIRLVMRFAGPRMIFRHPWLAIMHVIDGKRQQQIKPQRV
jgi:hypothetical protein